MKKLDANEFSLAIENETYVALMVIKKKLDEIIDWINEPAVYQAPDEIVELLKLPKEAVGKVTKDFGKKLINAVHAQNENKYGHIMGKPFVDGYATCMNCGQRENTVGMLVKCEPKEECTDGIRKCCGASWSKCYCKYSEPKEKSLRDAEYIVVSAETLNELTESVNQLLKSNWKLQGGVQVDGKVEFYYQAMVLKTL